MGEFIVAKLGIGPQEGMKVQSLTAVPPTKIDFSVFLFGCSYVVLYFFKYHPGVKEELECGHLIFNPNS